MNESIEVRGLTKRFDKKDILKRVDMDIPKGEFLSILGPSGSGKTTFLKVLAGILHADSGTITFPSEIKQSPVLVFQDYQLFPYMSVFNNIAFGLQARRLSRKETEKRVREMADKLGILKRIKAYPAQLSGGEKQRCALARALVINPQVLLLDEPFANLDKNLKSDTAQLLRRIQQDFNLTLISVTHDQEEAMMLSDTIALLIGGEIKEFGVAEHIYRRPHSLEGAQFFGKVNLLPSKFHDYFHLDEKASIYCRPENLDISANSQGIAIVEQRSFNGRVFRYFIRLGEFSLEVYSKEENLSPGDHIDVVLNESFCIPEDQHQKNIIRCNK
jgi:putative spermidine/putrescine transport system ATP-binding protein